MYSPHYALRLVPTYVASRLRGEFWCMLNSMLGDTWVARQTRAALVKSYFPRHQRRRARRRAPSSVHNHQMLRKYRRLLGFRDRLKTNAIKQAFELQQSA